MSPQSCQHSAVSLSRQNEQVLEPANEGKTCFPAGNRGLRRGTLEVSFAPMRSLQSRPAISCAIAALAFGASCALFRATAPFPDVPVVREKIEYFSKRRGEFDAVFIGSSRIHTGIVPRIFDRMVRSHGHVLHSFNLGVGGMHAPEVFYFLRAVAAQKPPRLKWVFVELENFHTEIPKQWRGTIREMYWHTGPETALLFRLIWAPAKSQESPLALVWRIAHVWLPHLALMMSNLSGFGRGPEIFLRQRASQGREDAGSLSQDAGFLSLGESAKLSPVEFADYEQALKRLDGKQPALTAADRVFLTELEQVENEFARLGARTIFIVPPTSSVVNKQILAGDGKRKHVLFAFDDPREFASLYSVSARRDSEHLKGSAAGEFTRLLARRFSEYLSAQP